MFTTLLLVLTSAPTFASEPVDATAPQAATPAAHRWVLLRDAHRYDELAVLSRDTTLTSALSELRRARFMAERMHAHYQPTHPRRVQLDTRVADLELKVAATADDLLVRSGYLPAQGEVYSGVSQGDVDSVGAGAGAGAF